MKQTTPSVFGSRLADYRKRHGLTGYDIEQGTGIKQPMISRWEKGEMIPSIPNLLKLARFLGVSSDYLLGLSDDPSPARVAVSASGGSVAVGSQSNSGGDNSIAAGVAAAGDAAAMAGELAEKTAEILNLRGIVATLQKAIDTICAKAAEKAAKAAAE